MRIVIAATLMLLAGCAATKIVIVPARVAAHAVKTGASAVGTAARVVN